MPQPDQPVLLPGVAPAPARRTAPPPLISVTIPSYNRPAALAQLLDSIVAQGFDDYEIVISDDHSPERGAVREVVARYQTAHPGRIWYYENDANLGYDANFRAMIRRAAGEFCFVMGNDDVVAPHAFETVADAVRRTPALGVVLRSFAYFRTRPEEYYTVARYYPDELVCAPGAATVELFFRRATVLSGIVVRRADALAVETDAFDGLLFYQKYLVAHLLMRRPGVIVPEVLAFYRMGGRHEFGTSAVERGRVSPEAKLDVGQAVRLLEGEHAIARGVDAAYGSDVYARVVRDEARYIFPTFAAHERAPLRDYWRLYRGLARLGFSRSPAFHATAAAVALFGGARLQRVVQAARRRLGYTPSFGGLPPGAVAVRSPRLGARLYATPEDA